MVCLTETSAYTRNYINMHNYHRAREALSTLHPAVSKQLTTWVWRRHMDDGDSSDENADTEAGPASAATNGSGHAAAIGAARSNEAPAPSRVAEPPCQDRRTRSRSRSRTQQK